LQNSPDNPVRPNDERYGNKQYQFVFKRLALLVFHLRMLTLESFFVLSASLGAAADELFSFKPPIRFFNNIAESH